MSARVLPRQRFGDRVEHLAHSAATATGRVDLVLDVSPSPGTPTYELLFMSASVIDTLTWLLGRAEVFPGLTVELRDRATELIGECPVSEEDLSGHLLAEANAAGWGQISDLAALFARSLLADFRIVKSPIK